MKITTFLLASVLMLAAPLSASVPALAHTSTGNACITTTVDGTPLDKPICDFPSIVDPAPNYPHCPAPVPADYSGVCRVNGIGGSLNYKDGVLV